MKKHHIPRAGEPKKQEPKPAPPEPPPDEIPPSEVPPGPPEQPEQAPPEVPVGPGAPEMSDSEGSRRVPQSDPDFMPAETDPMRHPKNRKRPIEREKGRHKDTGRGGA